MTSQNSQRLFTQESVTNIVNSRLKTAFVRRSDVGHKLKFLVQGNGNEIDAKYSAAKGGGIVQSVNGGNMRKTIYNLQAISEVAFTNPRNREFLAKGVAAEQAGLFLDAHNFYNAFLNAIQVSFSVIVGPGAPVFVNNDEVAGIVTLVTTEKGELLTLDKISAVPLANAAKVTTKLSIADMLGIGADEFTKLFDAPAEVGSNATVGA